MEVNYVERTGISMKKTYVTPCAFEECFSANSYVAACAWHITSTAGNNRMQCANPSHGHFMDGTYFTSVWVAATNSSCDILVDEKGITQTSVNGGNTRPTLGATVYGKTGTAYTCTKTYERPGDKTPYYVPDFVTGWETGSCYGTYVNTGTYDEIIQKVLS